MVPRRLRKKPALVYGKARGSRAGDALRLTPPPSDLPSLPLGVPTSPRLRVAPAGAGEGRSDRVEARQFAQPANPSPASLRSATSPRKRGEVRGESPALTESIDDITREESLARIREVIQDPVNRTGVDREDLLKQVADAHGVQRLGPRIREELEGDLLAAVRRRIIRSEDGLYFVETRTIADYSRDELRVALRSAIGKTWTDREEAIRQAAKHLGFRRAGANIQEAFKTAINGALRTGELEASDDDRIRAG